MEAPPPASAPLLTQGLAYSQPHLHSHLHSHSLADKREESGRTDSDKAGIVMMHTRLTQTNAAGSKGAIGTKGRGKKGSASVLLVAVSSPADVLSVRNELACVEKRDAAEAAATAAAASTPLADAAAFFGGVAASLLPPLDFHARAASAAAKRARDAELLVYANLSYACVRGTPCYRHVAHVVFRDSLFLVLMLNKLPMDDTGHPLLIVTSPVRSFIHFAQVAYIVDEQHLGAACQFALVLNTRQELRFLCNSSSEYLQWIDCLYNAYTACHSSPINQIPRDLDYDDRKSIYSQFGGGPRRPASGLFSQQIPQHNMSRSGSHNPGYSYSPQLFPNILSDGGRMMISSSAGMMRQPSNQRQIKNKSRYLPAKAYSNQQITRHEQNQQENSDQYYNGNKVDSGHLDSSIKLMSPRTGASALKKSPMSEDRFKRSTRPTKMHNNYGNIDNDDDEIDFESGSDFRYDSDIVDFANQRRMQRSVSTPPMSFYSKTAATTIPVSAVTTTSRNQASSGNGKRRSWTAEEVYEMTVNAYQAGLTEEVDEERRRNASTFRNNNRNIIYGSNINSAVIPGLRISSSSTSLTRGGFPTRAGSLVRFSGEDEVAYDTMHMHSDASSGGTGSRGSSLQRRDGEYSKSDNGIEEENDNTSVLMQVKNQENHVVIAPTLGLQNFESRSKSVDTRARSAAAAQHDILKARRKEVEKELATIPLILAARSASVDTRSTSAAARLFQSPSSSPLVHKKNFKKESLHSIPSFNFDVPKKDAYKTAVNSNSLNSEAKDYLLSTLFGTSSKNLPIGMKDKPTVQSAQETMFSNSEENDSNLSNESHYAVATSPTSKNTTIVGAVVVSSPPLNAVPNQEYHQLLPKVSQYLPNSPPPPPPQPPSSLSSPLQAKCEEETPNSVDKTTVEEPWLEYAANLSVTEHIELLSTDTLVLLQEMRFAKNEATAGLVGATAFGLGYYDDFGRPTKQAADVTTEFSENLSAVSAVKQQLEGDDENADGLVEEKNAEIIGVPDYDDEMNDSDSSASVTGSRKSRLHQTSPVNGCSALELSNSVGMMKSATTAAIARAKSPTNSDSTLSPSSPSPALKKVFNNVNATAANLSLASSTLPFSASPNSSTAIGGAAGGGGGESPASSSFSSFTFPPPRSMSRTYSKKPTHDGSTKMSFTTASLRESLIESLQSSPGYVNATIAEEQQQHRKADLEKLQNVKAKIVETLQKFDPVVKGTVVTSTASVVVPAADEGGDGVVKRAVGAFESLQQRSGDKM
ncbi:hypothetical protein HK100_007206 [Physocladia obscura]|uniref:Uncharacterized protein n=1 Tax=Physocladia obscura TaxID=109957 RepID=A0AAD5T540_9FUNG|nr:hypothetical protein HK100_007206 [Physocladia obscura]